ncbi:MAG: GNAT family N-acetyltransferase [Pseudomonadota bacterium]
MTHGGGSSDDVSSKPLTFALRPCTEEDFDFARTLYVSCMQPLLRALGAWDAEKLEAAFESYFDVNEISIITMKGEDVGWIQVSDTDDELCLDQLHLIETVRDKGTGTYLINSTISEAARQSKKVSLSLVKGNRAQRLYERLGFRQVAEDDTKIHMAISTDLAR